MVFMGSYLSEEMLGSSGDKAIKFKAEKIYNGEIVTPTSIHYRGEPYVNTDSTIWLRTGSESFCGRPFDSTRAIYIVDYNSWINLINPDSEVGYIPSVCFSDYFPISDDNEVTGWIWEQQDTTIALEEFEALIENTCGAISSVDDTDDSNQISIYPNPVNDILSIKCSAQCTIKNIELYDIQGNLIKSSIATSIDMSNLNSGVYLSLIHI